MTDALNLVPNAAIARYNKTADQRGVARRFHYNPGQLRAIPIVNSHRSTLGIGGARSGKTFFFVKSVVQRALRAEGSRHGMFRYRNNAARASLWLDTFPSVMRSCFEGTSWREDNRHGFIELPNGAELWIGGLDEKERVEKILGLEFVTIFLNEASQIPYSSRLVVKTRLAQVVKITSATMANQHLIGTVLPQREFVDLNPGGSNHWTYREFIQNIDPQDHARKLRDPENYGYFYINPLDNKNNLTPEFLQSLANLPEKQRKRFFEGVYVPEVEGALWSYDSIARARMDMPHGHEVMTGDVFKRLITAGILPSMQRVIVAVDPSGTKGIEEKRNDMIGILVVGKGMDGRGYVIADRSVNAPPGVWGRVVATAYSEFMADCVVAEVNFGGAMVEAVILAADPLIPYREVNASRGKAVRAEPVSVLYERDMVTHLGSFPQLEEQMSNFSVAGYIGEGSPDRADALVWGLTEVMIAEDDGAIWRALANKG